ncbi:MAG: PA2778 family cysteine peptidase [Desulfobacterales bacterium]|nr:MAG: PA2778 family cysteine peptidase [Desulfobacterales bacterium]
MPPRVELEAVPYFPQEAYQCGPAALAMALQWSGLSIRPASLTDQVYTPFRKGSLQAAMISAARRHGRIAYVTTGMDALFAELAGSHPLIVLQNLGRTWYPIWHYAIVIGYDVAAELVILHSGVTARKRMSWAVFQRAWAASNYWGLVILRPTQLPVTAQLQPFLTAVHGLERAGQWQAAIAGYETALARWPDSLAAIMGRGNSYYAQGDLEQAEASFREAIRRHPTAGSAFNNLAHVLAERGQRSQALEAARKAVALGGPQAAVYQKTLEEIQTKLE